jgi:uncharacterized protein (TIGR03086 family)
MAEMPELLAAAADRAAGVVRNVDENRLAAPTPCAEYDVRTLINHLLGVLHMFEAIGRKEEAPDDTLTRDYMRGDWKAVFEEQAKRLLAVWEDPRAYEGLTPGGFPALVGAQMVLGDLVLHGWDLARATGQDFDVREETAGVLCDFAAMMGDRGREAGVFGEPVPVPDDAPAFEKALGLSGRDPRWMPITD